MLVGIAVVVSGIGWLVSGSGPPKLATSADPGRVRSAPVHVPSLVTIVPAVTRFSGTLPLLPLPSAGQSAVFVQGIGLLGASADEQAVPMASVTKVMTAVVVLEDHALGHGSGPTFVMTAADHAAWIRDVENGDSSLEVVAGERLTERQLLEGLMIPSACNIADYLARWDAGSIDAFVRKMNAMAAALGLKHTHYADASGLSPGSRSTAIDQAVLGAYAMSIPGMISVEDHSTMDFPTGWVGGYNPALGQDGVIGLKSGFTDAAQICLVTAARRIVGGHRVLIVSVTLGQPSSLEWAADIDIQLLDAATSDLQVRPLLRRVPACCQSRRALEPQEAGRRCHGSCDGCRLGRSGGADRCEGVGSLGAWHRARLEVGYHDRERGGGDARRSAVRGSCKAEPFPVVGSSGLVAPAADQFHRGRRER